MSAGGTRTQHRMDIIRHVLDLHARHGAILAPTLLGVQVSGADRPDGPSYFRRLRNARIAALASSEANSRADSLARSAP